MTHNPNFLQRVLEIEKHKNTDKFLLLSPRQSDMPAPIHWHDDPFFPFSKGIIQATHDVVVGYIFDFAAYLAHGAAGAVALERSMAYVPNQTIKILHGQFANPDYRGIVIPEAFHADAITIQNIADYPAFTTDEQLEAFLISNNVADVPIYHGEQLIWPNHTIMRVAGHSVLYAGYGEDYQTACREALTNL